MAIGRVKIHRPKTKKFSRTRQEVGGKKRTAVGLCVTRENVNRSNNYQYQLPNVIV